MSATGGCELDLETLDDLLDRTVEVPVALLLAAACGCGPRGCCC